MRTLWRIIVSFFAILGAIIFLGIVGSIAVFTIAQSRGPHVADRTVHTHDFKQGQPHHPPGST